MTRTARIQPDTGPGSAYGFAEVDHRTPTRTLRHSAPTGHRTLDTGHYLAIDLGASSGRGILGHLRTRRPESREDAILKQVREDGGGVREDGGGVQDDVKIELEEIHRFETPVIEDGGHFYWDLAALTADVKTCIEKALRLRPKLRSVSVDSWAVDYVPLDDSGKPLRDPYCYRDPRTEGMIEKAFESISRSDLYELTGIQYLNFNTLFQLLADREFQPELFARAHNRLLIADYFNHVLGGRAVIDLSMASTTHLLDAQSQKWSDRILDAFGIRRQTLPKIVASGKVIGRVSGAPATSVIATCSHDTGAAVAAVPAADGAGGWCYLSLGTWALLGVERDTPILTESAMEAGFTNEVGLGGRIRFLKNLIGMWPLQECMREWNESETVTYEQILDEAVKAPQAKRFIDLMDARFTAPGAMERRLVDYCDEKGIARPADRGGLVRLILASIAHSIEEAVSELESVTDDTIHMIHIVGGGSQNHFLCQMIADMTGRRVTAGPVEATALGNVLIQARTMGDIPIGVTIRDVVRNSFEVAEFSSAPIARNTRS